MITPRFFSWDNFNDYANGPLDNPGRSVVWALPGTTVQYLPLIISDNFDTYPVGPLPSPNGGSNWAEAGTTTLYSNS